MKNWTTKRMILFALGIASGIMIYDYLKHNSIDWVSSISIGIIAMVLLFVLKKVSKK